DVERDAIKPLARGAPYGVDHHVRPICASDRHAAGEGPEAERPAGVELDDAIDAFGLGLSLRARRAERTGEDGDGDRGAGSHGSVDETTGGKAAETSKLHV